MATGAAGCGNTVNIGQPTASGVNSSVNSSPVVFNYPVQPPDDTGRMLAIGSIIGGLFDALLGGDALGGAQDAQNVWKDTLDGTMTPRGKSELNYVDTVRNKLPPYESDLSNMLTLYRDDAAALWPKLDLIDGQIKAEIDSNLGRSDTEYNYANIACMDDAIAALCTMVGCGYTPDYAGIATRARADAEVASVENYRSLCRTGNRYNSRATQTALMEIRLQTTTAALVASSVSREAERIKSFEINENLRFKGATTLENIRLGRRELSLKYDNAAGAALRERWNAVASTWLSIQKLGDSTTQFAWKAYAESAFKSYELGGQMMASAMQAYQAFAESVRATARQGGGGGGISGMIAQITAILTLFSGGCDPVTFGSQSFFPRPQNCCGS